MTIERKKQKIFAGSAVTDPTQAFGSKSQGSPIESTDIDVIQTTEWESGLESGIINTHGDRKAPLLTEINGLYYTITKQINNIFGLSGYHPHLQTQEYAENVYVFNSGDGKIYRAKIDVPEGELLTNLTYWEDTGKNITTFLTTTLLSSDVIDNLTSTDTDKPLSANQGKELEDNKADKSELAIIGDTRTSTKCKQLKNSKNINNREHSVFLMEDGTIKGCGIGDNFGHIGGDYNLNVHFPTNVAIDNENPPQTKFVDVALEVNCGFALTEDGDIYSWGQGTNGVLGHGNTQDQKYAKRIDYFYDNTIKISKLIPQKTSDFNDDNTMMFITTTGLLYGCGQNSAGVLGDGSIVDRYTPVLFGGGAITDVIDVILTCGASGSVYVITDDGVDKKLFICGKNENGNFGLGDTTSRSTPEEIIQFRNDIKKVDAEYGDLGGIHISACVIDNAGDTWFAGANEYGQLGFGDTTQRITWAKNTNLSNIKDVIIGGGRTMTIVVIDDNDTLKIAGYGLYGQTGQNTTTDQWLFISPEVTGANLDFQGKIKKVIIAGYDSTSAVIVLDTDGYIYGCGYGLNGNLSRGIFQSTNLLFKRFINDKIASETRKATDIVVYGHSLYWCIMVLYDDGLARATGNNISGMCGNTDQEIVGGQGIDLSFLRDVKF